MYDCDDGGNVRFTVIGCSHLLVELESQQACQVHERRVRKHQVHERRVQKHQVHERRVQKHQVHEHQETHVLM